MSDLLLAAGAFTLVVAAALAVLAALTLVPFVLTLQRAERLGRSTLAWGAVALAGSLAGVALVAGGARAHGVVRPLLVVVGGGLAFLAPAAVRLLVERPPAGRHA